MSEGLVVFDFFVALAVAGIGIQLIQWGMPISGMALIGFACRLGYVAVFHGIECDL